MSSNFDLDLAIDQACDRAQEFLDQLRNNKSTDGDPRMSDVRLLGAFLRQIPIPPLPDRPSGAMPLQGLGLGIVQPGDDVEFPVDSSSVLQALKPLLEFIYSGEGDYDSYNRGKAGDSPGGWSGGLRKLTIAQVMQLQAQRGVFAVGAAQFIPTTLKLALRESGLNENDLFNADNQDRLAISLLLGSKRPKLAAYLKGKNNDLDEAQIELAKEWASVPMPNGRSYYDGDSAGNRATKKVAEVRKALKDARDALLKVNRGSVGPSGLGLHVVQAGETLGSIADRHDTTVEELLAINPSIQDRDQIFPDQRIIVMRVDGDAPFIDSKSRVLNFPIKIAEHQLSSSTYQVFQHTSLGKITITGGYMEPEKHSWKPELKAIFADGKLKTLPPAPRNIGIDYIVADRRVKAWYGGKVTKVGREGGYGRRLHIQLDVSYDFNGKSYQVYQAYAHLQKIFVREGQTIQQGEEIAIMGGSGARSDRDYPLHVDLSTYLFINRKIVQLNPQALDMQLA